MITGRGRQAAAEIKVGRSEGVAERTEHQSRRNRSSGDHKTHSAGIIGVVPYDEMTPVPST